MSSGRFAITALAVATAASKRPSVITSYSIHYTKLYDATADGRFDAAVATAKAVIANRPEDMLGRYVLATERARSGDWAGAEAHVKAIPHANLNALLGPLLNAWAAVGRGDVDEGLKRLQPLAARKPFLPIYNFSYNFV